MCEFRCFGAVLISHKDSGELKLRTASHERVNVISKLLI